MCDVCGECVNITCVYAFKFTVLEDERRGVFRECVVCIYGICLYNAGQIEQLKSLRIFLKSSLLEFKDRNHSNERYELLGNCIYIATTKLREEFDF